MHSNPSNLLRRLKGKVLNAKAVWAPQQDAIFLKSMNCMIRKLVLTYELRYDKIQKLSISS